MQGRPPSMGGGGADVERIGGVGVDEKQVNDG